MITAINPRDYILFQAVVLISAVIYLLLTTFVDISYLLLDPRVRRVRTA